MPDARFAGVPVPSTAPTFRTERFPLWAENVRSTTDPDRNLNSPVMSGTDSSGNLLRHFSTNGNAYWNLPLNAADTTAMSWTKEDYFGFKCYFRLRSVAGRIQVWRKGESGRGGPFFEVVDGKPRFGWWDNSQKREVYVETDVPIVQAGAVYYVYIRKRWPPQNATDGNWENSLWSNNRIRRLTMASAFSPTVGGTVTDGVSTGVVLRRINSTTFDVYTTSLSLVWAGPIGVTNISAVDVPSSDLFTIKRFFLATDPLPNFYNSYSAVTNATTAWVQAVSFTTGDVARVAGVVGRGIVSPAGVLFDGAAAGVVSVNAASPYTLREEMRGMLFSWGSAAPVAFRNRTYQIIQVTSTTQMLVVDYETGVLVDFTAVGAGVAAQISTGIELVKSEGFDSAPSPDDSGSTIYFMGSRDQGTPTSTYQPFDGEVWCPAWMVDAPASAGVDARVFQDASATASDPTLIGSDYFEDDIYGAGTASREHQLQVTASYVTFAWDMRTYGGADIAASTQPAALPPDALGTTGPTITVSASSPAILGTSKPFWEYVQPRSVWASERWVAVGFRDPVQGIAGRPGPAARIKAIEDDTTNPSGVVRVVVSDLPVGPLGTEVVVYESAAGGNAQTLFEAARVPNGTSEVAVQALESLLTLTAAVDFTADQPPRCKVLAASAERLVYGALESQPDGCVPSRVGFPGLADFSRIFRLAGGNGNEITGLLDLDGQLAVFKRRAMGSVRFNELGFAVVELVSSGVGCLAHQTLQSKDSMLWFLSDRGVQVSERGFTNLGKPQYVGVNVETFFTEEADLRKLTRATAAINRARNQYVVALRVAGQPRMNARITAELRGQRIAFSRYYAPNLSALATVQPREPGAEVTVGGTEEGFVVWLDRADTNLVMMGPDAKLWGALSLQCFGGTQSTTLGMDTDSSTDLDFSLVGPMGVTARYLDATGEERLVTLLGSDSDILHYGEALLEPIPDETRVFLGAMQLLWETPWLDMENPERKKRLQYIDLVLETQDAQTSGTLTYEVYGDWDFDNVLAEGTLTLGAYPYRIVPKSVRARFFKLRLLHSPDTSDVGFDLAQIVWRVTDEDQV